MDDLAIYQRAEKELIDFVCSEPFLGVLQECRVLPERLRYEFVELVLLDDDQLIIRGVTVPLGLKIQRSFFADQRPTLFCVTKALPDGLEWHKITVTFDNSIVGLEKPAFAKDLL